MPPVVYDRMGIWMATATATEYSLLEKFFLDLGDAQAALENVSADRSFAVEGSLGTFYAELFDPCMLAIVLDITFTLPEKTADCKRALQVLAVRIRADRLTFQFWKRLWIRRSRHVSHSSST